MTLFLMCLIGGAFALGLMALRKVLEYRPALGGNIPIVRNIVSFAEDGVVPYGIPIGIAALLAAPGMF
jgi:Flp pilus assembly protein protease CpaA